VAWWYDHLLSGDQQRAQYPVRVFARFGLQGLRDTPRLAIGTGHSFKGAEADCTLLAPDLSKSAFEAFESPEGKDSTLRQWYVMQTRTREHMIFLEPSTKYHLEGV
jgi:hypothetical protein